MLVMNKIILLLISIFCLIISFNDEVYFFSERVYITSVSIQIISLVIIFSDKNKPYSLFKIFYLFSFLFFGIAPIIQFYSKSTIYDARLLKESEVFATNCIINIILILHYFFYKFFYSNSRISANNNSKYEYLVTDKILSTRQMIVLILMSVFSFFSVLYNNNFSILSMLLRGGSFKEESIINASSIYLIVEQVFRPIAMISFLYYINTKSKNKFMYIILFLLAILTCFPTGIPRFYAAALYIPLCLMSFSWIRKQNVFSYVIIVGMLFLFPFLDNFREFSSDRKFYMGLDFKMFKTGHFDSFQNFALIMNEDIVTGGRQLLGVIFFWIPRIFWPSKPIGSGTVLAEQAGFEFDNISANIFAEGYINFGYIGILMFLIGITYITARIDKIYWTKTITLPNSPFRIIYLILLGMYFFIIRGDLLSSTAYTIGFFISYNIVAKLTGRSNKAS